MNYKIHINNRNYETWNLYNIKTMENSDENGRNDCGKNSRPEKVQKSLRKNGQTKVLQPVMKMGRRKSSKENERQLPAKRTAEKTKAEKLRTRRLKKGKEENTEPRKDVEAKPL